MKLNFELPEKIKMKVLQSLMTDILYCVPLGMDVAGFKHEDSYFVIGEDKWLTVQNGEIEKVEYIRDCKDFMLKPMIGNAFIKCTIGSNVAMVARFSMTEVVRFGYIVQILNQMVADLPVSVYNNDRERICDKCGRILIRGTNLCPKCSKKGQAVKQIFSLAGRYMPYLMGTLVVFLVCVIANFIEVDYYAAIVDYCFNGGNLPEGFEFAADMGRMDAFVRFMGTVIALGLTRFFLGIVGTLFANNFNQKFTTRLRKEIFDKVQSLSINYVTTASPGDIMNRTFSDTSTINSFLQQISVNLIKSVFSFVVALIMLFKRSWLIAIMILIPAPVSLFVQRYAWKYVYGKIWKGLSKARDKSSSYLHDIMSGIKVVKVFGTEERATANFKKYSRNVADMSIRGMTLAQIFNPIATIVMNVGQYLVYAVGGIAIYVGVRDADPTAMTLGAFTAMLGIVSRVYEPLNMFVSMPQMIANSMISIQRVYEILNQVPEIGDKSDSVQHRIDGNIDFENVSFGYNSYDHVLNDITFHVQKGEMIGLVGRSGSGKSTLTNLVCRFYDVNEGSIKIDGVDIRNIQQTSLTSQIGVVLQENFLFSGPLYENIRYSKPDATYEEVIRAAKIANAHEFIINLPDGYDTWVAEGGSNFSGGEKQRIAIARAILSDPAILILDEATSALDVETEAQIQEALQRLIEGRTTFAIAHRLSTLKNANRLFVMDKGKIVEMGTHDELLKKKGIYFSLVMAQRTMAKRKDKADTVSELLAN